MDHSNNAYHIFAVNVLLTTFAVNWKNLLWQKISEDAKVNTKTTGTGNPRQGYEHKMQVAKYADQSGFPTAHGERSSQFK